SGRHEHRDASRRHSGRRSGGASRSGGFRSSADASDRGNEGRVRAGARFRFDPGMTVAPIYSRGLVEATQPPEYRGITRDGVRMLVTDRETRSNSHAHFYDLPSLLRPGDLVVVNDSATLPAAILARRSSGDSVQLHVSTKIDERLWMVEPRGPVDAGD